MSNQRHHRDRMRIAVISHLKYPIAEPFPGGLEMHTHLLVRHLRRRGHEVTLFASEGSDASMGLVPVCAPTGTPGDDPREVEAVALAEHRAYAAIMRAVRAGGFDLVHNNSLHYLPLLEARGLAAPFVTSLHTPPFPELESGVLDARGGPVRFVGVSEVVRGMWRDVVPVDAVIPNGIDLDLFVPGGDAVPAAPGGGAAAPGRGAAAPGRSAAATGHAVWFGRLVPEKGPHLAIAAARRAGMPLRLAGPASDPDYWAEAIAPALGEGVRYLGHLDHAALSREVASAAVALCTPRWEEPYGLVVAEALACGTPVAGFRRGALPEILDRHTGRLAPADDVAALAAAIPEAARLSRAACRRRAERVCDARVMVDRYEALFRSEIERFGRHADGSLAGSRSR